VSRRHFVILIQESVQAFITGIVANGGLRIIQDARSKKTCFVAASYGPIQ
jgi:hypothetical protein